MTFAEAARKYMKVEPNDYYYAEYDSGLDHLDGEDLSRLCRWFYSIGRDDAREQAIEDCILTLGGRYGAAATKDLRALLHANNDAKP